MTYAYFFYAYEILFCPVSCSPIMSCNEHNSTNKFFFWENFRVACQNDVPQIFSHFYSLSLSFNLFCVLKFHHYKKTLGIESTNEPKCESRKKIFMCTSCHYHKTNDLYFRPVHFYIDHFDICCRSSATIHPLDQIFFRFFQ